MEIQITWTRSDTGIKESSAPFEGDLEATKIEAACKVKSHGGTGTIRITDNNGGVVCLQEFDCSGRK